MSITPRAVINMVKNTITSQENHVKHEADSSYLKKEKEQIYVQFQNERIEIWHNGEHQKGIEIKNQVDMKGAMAKADEIIKEINGHLDNIVRQKQSPKVDKTFENEAMSKIGSNAVVVKQQPGKQDGIIIAENKDFVAHRLGENSKYVMFHSKASLDQVPPVGAKVTITVPNDQNAKTKVVKSLDNSQTISKSR